MMKECVECEGLFDPRSPAKQRAGGRVNTCPDCSSESTVRYLGLSAGDGKQAGITVLKFETAREREEYRQMWWVNSGMMVGKSCQLGFQKRTPNVRFTTVTQSTATNHKGKL